MVADLQIGVLEPSAWSRVKYLAITHSTEDAHVVRPAGEASGSPQALGQHQVLGDELDVHHAAGDCFEVELSSPSLQSR